MAEEEGALARDLYIEAAMVSCPQCKAPVGKPCSERYCKNSRRNCDYAVCARWRDRNEPHLERSVRARQQRLARPDAAVAAGGESDG